MLTIVFYILLVLAFLVLLSGITDAAGHVIGFLAVRFSRLPRLASGQTRLGSV